MKDQATREKYIELRASGKSYRSIAKELDISKSTCQEIERSYRKLIPIEDSVFNNLKWKPVDGQELDSIITGLTIVGSEPTDYPLTDGITLYLKNGAGELLALDIGADIYSVEKEENPFYMALSHIPHNK